MTVHESTKAKLRRKIEEHEALKRRNHDTRLLMYYGDARKDDEVAQHRQRARLLMDDKDECLLLMDKTTAQSQEARHRRIRQWLFDYGRDDARLK